MSQMYSDGGPYPAEALYPAEDLFPYSTGMVLQRFGGPARYQQFTMTGLTLYGPGTFEFLCVVSGSFSAEQLQRLMTDASFSPEYGSGTLLLAGFNGNLEAGNLQSPTETIVGLALYRLLAILVKPPAEDEALVLADVHQGDLAADRAFTAAAAILIVGIFVLGIFYHPITDLIEAGVRLI